MEDPQAIKSCDIIKIEDSNSNKQLQRKTPKVNILGSLKDLWKEHSKLEIKNKKNLK